MVALMNETDIDRFIREQKSKLENERNNFMFAKDDSRSILQLGQYENHRKKLQEERFNDYNNYLQNKKSYQKEPISVKSKSHEQLHVQNLEEHLKELQKTSTGKFLADTEQPHRSTWSSLSQKSQPRKKEPNDFFANFGEYENTKKKLKEERERDYHRHLAEFVSNTKQPQRSTWSSLSKKSQPRKKEPDVFFANFGEYENTKKKLNEERERNFNRHLAENTNRGDSLLTNGKLLSNRENRIVWADQAYGKRSAPPLYRGDADYNYDYPLPKLKTAANERTSNKYDINLKDLTNEYSARLSQPNLHEEIENRLRPMASTFAPVSNNFFDDPLWARLRENPQEIGLGPHRSTFVMPDDYMRNTLNNVERNNSKSPYTPANQLFIPEPVSTRATHLQKNQTETYATLPIGNNQESEKQRQKHNYREELQKQMQERNELRLREKQLAKSPFSQPKADPLHPVPPLEFQTDHRSKLINPQKFEHLQHESGLSHLFGPNFDQHQRQNLTNNFSPNFMYDQLHFDGQNNPIDKAYTFYGMKGHFDDIPPPANDMSMFTPSMKKPAEYVPQTSYSNRPTQNSPVQFGPSSMMFGSDNSNSSVKKREDYMKALEVQMQEKKLKKLKAKQDQDRYDKRLEEENKQYNPFGRGGGGAPLKDSSGNVIANLRQMKQNDFNQPASLTQTMSPTAVPPTIPQSQQLDKENLPGTLPDVNEEVNNARGGHGIFGEPKTDAQKTAKEKYLEDLQKQMLDKKNQKLAEAEKERLEEEKINKQLEEQRRKMQEEFEEEEKKRKAKMEEKRKAEEEMRRQIEEKKKEAKRLRREENEKRRNEENPHEEIKTEAPPIVQKRPKSPPVPALQRKLKLEARADSPQKRPKSPPVPALQSKMKLEVRADSERQELSPVSSDDQSLRTPETNADEILEPPTDVLFNARRVSPDIVEPLTFASPDILQDFNQLTYRKQTGSRNAFRNQFPDSPRDRATLELQQRALINRQEKNLQKYRKNGSLRMNNDHDHPPLLRQKTVSPQPLLDSKSSFFDADSMPLLSDVFSENRIKRPDSARLRRRLRLQSPQLTLLDGVSLRSNSADSLMSLNPDKIARKNEARLKKLQNMTDGVSLTEPEDILDKFMAKQNRSRPSSLFDGFN